MPIIDRVLAGLEDEARRTQRVLETSSAGAPHAKSFSLGQLAMHVGAT